MISVDMSIFIYNKSKCCLNTKNIIVDQRNEGHQTMDRNNETVQIFYSITYSSVLFQYNVHSKMHFIRHFFMVIHYIKHLIYTKSGVIT